MNIGNNILTLRKSKGLTQDELADKLNVSRQAVSKWELGASKPDIENIIKLSKLFKITIDEIVNNDVIKTEALSVDINEDDKKVDILIWVRRLMVLLAIFFTLNTIYKCVILFRITSIEKQYKELNNYHYVITTYDEVGLIEEEECWFKDGISKTEKTVYNAEGNNKTITNVDYNSNNGYIQNNYSNDKVPINMEEYLIFNEDYDLGAQLYSNLPQRMSYEGIGDVLSRAFFSNIVVKVCSDNILVCIDNDYFNLYHDTLLPITYCYRDKVTDKFLIKNYLIEFNCVESIAI